MEKYNIRIDADINFKVLPGATGPFMVIRADSHTTTVLQHGLENTVLVDRVTKIPDPHGSTCSDAALKGDETRTVSALIRDLLNGGLSRGTILRIPSSGALVVERPH